MSSLTRGSRLALGASWLALLAACAVGPDYHRPKIDAAPSYKEAGDWKPSEPNDALGKGAWWEIYGDDALNQLEVKVDISNENVKAAAAAFDQARALVAQARAGFWPTVGASAGVQRGGTPVTTVNAAGQPLVGTRTQNTFSAGVSGNWALDIWARSAAPPRAIGRRRRPARRRSQRRDYPRSLSSPPIISNCAPKTSCRSCWTTP